jgi:hypothetical protein
MWCCVTWRTPLCRRALLPGRAGGNVYSIRDGRNVGYAPATINRRLAAVSGLFGYGAMRDPAAPGRNGALACGSASRGGCPAAWTAPRPPRCGRASAPIRKGVPGH